jgi:hypothetical protein
MRQVALVMTVLLTSCGGVESVSGDTDIDQEAVEAVDAMDTPVEVPVDSWPEVSSDTSPPDTVTDTVMDTATDWAPELTGRLFSCDCYDVHSPDPDTEPIWTQEVCTENLLSSLDEIIDDCEATLDTWCNCSWSMCKYLGECYL